MNTDNTPSPDWKQIGFELRYAIEKTAEAFAELSAEVRRGREAELKRFKQARRNARTQQLRIDIEYLAWKAERDANKSGGSAS